MSIILSTDFPDLKLIGRGKVRDIYDLGEELLIVSTDRLSAFDIILPDGIKDKGKVLTKLSSFWFEKTKHIINNHLITTDINNMPSILMQYKDILKDRSMLVKKAKPIMAECIVRGYITGSGLKEYNKTGMICGINLPSGLQESDKLPNPIFTPSTKADVGHDENVTFENLEKIIGSDVAKQIKEYSLNIYKYAYDYALSKGIIIADTKLEFGIYNDNIILIDEVLTPDSSRFWYNKDYKPGKIQDSMDKQIVRNYLETLDWNKQYPGPNLPKNISDETSKRYIDIADQLMK